MKRSRKRSRRLTVSNTPISNSNAFLVGDVVWAKYRGVPWPAKVTSIREDRSGTKISYIFLPDGRFKSVFHLTLPKEKDKIALFRDRSEAPDVKPKVQSIMKEACDAAEKLLSRMRATSKGREKIKKRAAVTVDVIGQIAAKEEVVAKDQVEATGSESIALGNPFRIRKKKLHAEMDSGLEEQKKIEITWVSTSDTGTHSRWPALVTRTIGEYHTVVFLPVVGNCVRHRCKITSCTKFDFNAKSLHAAINKETNPELKEALKSAYNLLYGTIQKSIKIKKDNTIEISQSDQKENSDISKDGEIVNVEETDHKEGKGRKKLLRKSAGVLAPTMLATDERNSEARRRGAEPDYEEPPRKVAKYSEDIARVEENLAKRKANLSRGDVIWTKSNKGELGKWPSVVLETSKETSIVRYVELPYELHDNVPLDDQLTADLKDILLYDEPHILEEELKDKELKKAVSQATKMFMKDPNTSAKADVVEANTEESKDIKYEDMSGREAIKRADVPKKQAVIRQLTERKMAEEKAIAAERVTEKALSAQEILAHINTSFCKSHLLAIFSGNTSSDKYDAFKAVDPNLLENTPPTCRVGGLLSKEEVNEVINKFKPMFKFDSDAKLEHFMCMVIVPEAVIFAITQIRKISGYKALEVFDDAVARECHEQSITATEPDHSSQHQLEVTAMSKSDWTKCDDVHESKDDGNDAEK